MMILANDTVSFELPATCPYLPELVQQVVTAFGGYKQAAKVSGNISPALLWKLNNGHQDDSAKLRATWGLPPSRPRYRVCLECKDRDAQYTLSTLLGGFGNRQEIAEKLIAGKLVIREIGEE